MTPLDDTLAPVPKDLSAFNITIPKYPNSASCSTCGDRSAAREARARKGAKRARVMHLRCCGLTPDELAGVSGWQHVSEVQRDCLVRDIYDEKEIKTSDPAPQTEVEDGVTQDVTLESELWTFNEVEWHETAQDTTTIKYVAIRTRIVQIEAGNALEILRQSQQTYVTQRTTKPRTDRPHGCHGQTQLKDDSTHQVSSGRRGRSESRQTGQGHQRNGPSF